ncbi:hypothetical protein HETIRDRAFT_18523, partial [Heterobasidion irregulare TC 32-1]
SAFVLAHAACVPVAVSDRATRFRSQVAFVNQNKVGAACDNLPVGEVLCLGVVGQDCATTHTVVSGDFCASIAGAASTLLANNPNVSSDCSNI